MVEEHPGRTLELNDLPIWRALPARGRRLIGRWCFLDRYGPLSFTSDKPMDVAPHPHIGIQTVSWLLEGEVIHHDSLGYEAVARPGGVNLMTSGSGIAHSEETPASNTGRLNGVQLWIALPDARRNDAASFTHIPEVPRDDIAQTFLSEDDLLGRDVEVRERAEIEVPLAHEHGLFVLSGEGALEGQDLETNTLYYLPPGRSSIAFEGNMRLLLLGGVPFSEPVLMWWNFVARTREEIAAARADWEAGRRFGEVRAYRGPRLSAPPLSRIVPPNPAS